MALAVANSWQRRFTKPALGSDGRVHFTWGNGEPMVVCSVMHWCDIALQPGEVLMQPANIGDPRWVSHLEVSGYGSQRTTHIVVKPSDNGLDSNLIAHTNRRSYTIRLLSNSRSYMPLVSFDYPDDTSNNWNSYSAQAGLAASPCDMTPSVPPTAFEIDKGNYSWRPTQVYAVATSVGTKTCIEFASDIGSTTLPALVVIADHGGWFSSDAVQAVNFRYETSRRRYVVDAALEDFELIQGVGENQRKIEIRNRGVTQ